MRTAMRSLSLVFLLMIGLVASTFGQGGATGAITGTVTDPTGAVVPNAEVRIVNKGTGEVARVVKTEPSGVFNAPLLPVGNYDITVSAPGFASGTVADVVVRITETTRMT